MLEERRRLAEEQRTWEEREKATKTRPPGTTTVTTKIKGAAAATPTSSNGSSGSSSESSASRGSAKDVGAAAVAHGRAGEGESEARGVSGGSGGGGGASGGGGGGASSGPVEEGTGGGQRASTSGGNSPDGCSGGSGPSSAATPGAFGARASQRNQPCRCCPDGKHVAKPPLTSPQAAPGSQTPTRRPRALSEGVSEVPGVLSHIGLDNVACAELGKLGLDLVTLFELSPGVCYFTLCLTSRHVGWWSYWSYCHQTARSPHTVTPHLTHHSGPCVVRRLLENSGPVRRRHHPDPSRF